MSRCFPVEGKPIGRALYEMHTERSRRYTINIDKSSDSQLVSKVKLLIKDMIAYKPAVRISMNEAVELLTSFRDSVANQVDSVAKKVDPVVKKVLLEMQCRSVWVRVGSAWEKQPNLPEEHPPLYICYCGVSDGIVAIGGGSGDSTVGSMCHYFSVITHSWRRLPDMPTPRGGASAAVVGHMLLVFGGKDKPLNYLAVCERFHMTD